MKSRSIRVLAALIAAGITTGSAEAQVVAGGQEVAGPTPAREISVAPERHPSSTQPPLGVWVECNSRWGLRCTAHAQGGTGTYVSWEWEGAVEDYDEGGSMSYADAGSVCVPGYWWSVLATVTDSSGARETATIMVYCSNPSLPASITATSPRTRQ